MNLKNSIIAALFTASVFAANINTEGSNEVVSIGIVDLVGAPVVILAGPIDYEMTALVLDSMMFHLTNGETEITILIDSPGGVVRYGLTVIELMETAQANGVRFRCLATRAYSMAAIISAYCDAFYIHKRGSLMHHEISFAVQGTLSEVKRIVEFIEKNFRDISGDMALNYGMTFDEFWAFNGLERFYSASETVRFGLADGLYDGIKFLD